MKKVDYTCIECGGPGNAHERLDGAVLLAEKLCSDCHFWIKKIKDTAPNRVIAKGHHYRIGRPGEAFPGFAGRKFVINFNDGRQITTTNLWHQGEVPARFRDRLPDNAVFVSDPDIEGRKMA
jgi:hypothetical protein